MKNFLLLIFISYFLFGCSEDRNEISSGLLQQQNDDDTTFTKLGDLSLVDYVSSACTAKLSGVDSPKQLLISYKCPNIEYAYTLNCSSDFLCSGTYGSQNNTMEVGLSADFKQVVVVWRGKDGVIDSENFVIAKEAN